MCDSVRVLSWANGTPDAPLMFVGEAPGRLGADRTAIPFHGDKAGDNFERLLELAGLNRSQVFITNAVLCNPRDDQGNNSPPASVEIENCAHHLKAQIEIVQPAMVMTLGSVALEAARHIEHHGLSLRESVRTTNRWFGRLLLPLYHPGARAMIHRSFANQTADYYHVGETFRRLSKKRRSNSSPIRGTDGEWNLVRYLLQKAGTVSNFRLHKLMYLTELTAIKKLDSRATNFLYLRQKDGPYCVELGSRWYVRFDDQVAIRKSAGSLMLEWRENGFFERKTEISMNPKLSRVVDEVIDSTARLSDSQLKTRTYLTEPMKRVLRAEKAGQTMINKPLLADAAA
jgi:uracil-DNA glycosylase family 4